LSKQFEAARLEEGKDDNLVQVVDPAQVPEWKSKPRRSMYALAGMLLAGLLASVRCIVVDVRRHAGQAR
jgi:tyrosine-protein kinase Etk/Wzc